MILFGVASADCEEVTPENVHLLEEARNALDEDGKDDFDYAYIYLSDLFASKVRGMRPQAPYLDNIKSDKVKQLFLACGPERKAKDENMISAMNYWNEQKKLHEEKDQEQSTESS